MPGAITEICRDHVGDAIGQILDTPASAWQGRRAVALNWRAIAQEQFALALQDGGQRIRIPPYSGRFTLFLGVP